MSSINTPTYFVQHPDGSHSMANPQPIPEFDWKLKDGGPIYPCRMPTGGKHSNDEPEPTKLHFGMSLRDYFAIHAPEPTKQQVDDYMSGWNVLDTRLARAELRYLEADAMLKAREGGSS